MSFRTWFILYRYSLSFLSLSRSSDFMQVAWLRYDFCMLLRAFSDFLTILVSFSLSYQQSLHSLIFIHQVLDCLMRFFFIWEKCGFDLIFLELPQFVSHEFLNKIKTTVSSFIWKLMTVRRSLISSSNDFIYLSKI